MKTSIKRAAASPIKNIPTPNVICQNPSQPSSPMIILKNITMAISIITTPYIKDAEDAIELYCFLDMFWFLLNFFFATFNVKVSYVVFLLVSQS